MVPLQNLILSFPFEIYKETYMKHISHRLKRIRKTRIFTNRGSSLGNFQLKTKKSCCLSPGSSRCETMPVSLLQGRCSTLTDDDEVGKSCSQAAMPTTLRLFSKWSEQKRSIYKLFVPNWRTPERKAQPNCVTLHCWKRWSSRNPRCSFSPSPHGQVPPARHSHE